MSLLRGWLFDNLGLKLVALLLALLVYLNVYTDRPATLIVSFPIQIADLADSLSLSGPMPAAVQAALRGTGKQLIRLRLTEPPVKISLAGIGTGRYERALTASDLPLPDEIQVERVVSPRTVELQVDRRLRRRLPVAPRIDGVPAGGVFWAGGLSVTPMSVEISGPAQAVAALDSVHLDPVSIAGKRDTVTVSVDADGLPDWCTMTPDQVQVTVPLEPEATRRLSLPIQPPRGGEGYTVTPAHVTVTVVAPRSVLSREALAGVRVHWTAPLPLSDHVGERVGLRRLGALPDGARARLDPDSVILGRERP
jgi:YbbR domain-containing protein